MPNPQPKIPPVVVGLVSAGLMWAVARYVPRFDYALPGRWAFAAALGGVGVIIVTLGVARFVRAKTTVNPLEPQKATTLVTHGIFAVTRNPMYLGLLVVLLGWGIGLANGLAIGVLPLYVAYMNRFQIAPEEAAMTERFGPDYVEYRRRVRRWL